MAEYIVDITTTKEIFESNEYFSIPNAAFREGIVRCCDCKYHYEEEPLYSLLGNKRHMCGYWASDHKVRPDGFCTWGERKVVDQTEVVKNITCENEYPDVICVTLLDGGGQVVDEWDYVPERTCKRVGTKYREMRCQIEWECSRCGFPLYSDHDSFCTECGAKVVE